MSDRLLELAADARSRIEHERGAVADPWSPETRAAVRALEGYLVEVEGIERRTAELAVTRWIITQRPIRECLAAQLAGEP